MSLDRNMIQSNEFVFSSDVFDGAYDFSVNAYNNAIAPLVSAALRGQSAVAMLGGPRSMDINSYLISHTNAQGLLNQAAAQLINATHRDGEKTGSVTFSWYTIDATSSAEHITDVLKYASQGSAAQADQNVLRELGKGIY